ncbi:MAG: IS110 family transposase [Candidatus Bathyarchaeota archaeon]|nr:IS110 family transposase [Candidatus Termiticorpusculum sp.]
MTTHYVGVDVGKTRCRAALMNQKGTIEKEFFFENTPNGIQQLTSLLSSEDQVVMESTANMWLPLYEAIDNKHIKVVLANPMKTKAIASARVKTDKVDAKILAHLLRADLVAESYVPPKQLRDIRALVRHRLSLTKIRTMVKNKVHALTDKYGYRCEYSDMFGVSGLKWLKSLEMNKLDSLVLENHLLHIESVNLQIKRTDEAILESAVEDEDVRLLLSLPGVDVRTALLLKSEIGRIDRFLDYKHLVSWAGLAPRVHQSGNVLWNGGITKCGSSILRWAMIEAAHTAVRCDERFCEFYGRVKARRGGSKAVVAVANRMLKVVWVMLVRREVYSGVNQRLYEEKLNRVGFDM